MTRYETSLFAVHPRTATAMRALAGVAIAAVAAAALITAGPGNGYVAPATATTATFVTLPTVTVVAQREAKQQPVALDAAAVKQVNLAR